jgi:hypothetical protein
MRETIVLDTNSGYGLIVYCMIMSIRRLFSLTIRFFFFKKKKGLESRGWNVNLRSKLHQYFKNTV